MLMTKIGDPRLEALPGVVDPRGAGVRPTVRLPRKGLSPMAFALMASVVGIGAVLKLSPGQVSQNQPVVGAKSASSSRVWAEPPPLFIPPDDPSDSLSIFSPTGSAFPAAGPDGVPQVRKGLRPWSSSNEGPVSTFGPSPFAVMEPNVAPGAPVLFDRGSAAGTSRPILGVADALADPGSPSKERVQSSVLSDPSTTVAQGSLIPAVLETGYDSSTPGFARAIVSRDVRSFDGLKVLIPRGSRIIGESRSTPSEGQTRAIITWTRLIRPDGTTIEMDSPTTDLLGHGGIPASVTKHSGGGFGDTIAKALVGLSRIASRVVGGPFVYLPGGGNSGDSQLNSRPSRPPTLKVAPGTSINVFVAHDLDFSAAGPAGE